MGNKYTKSESDNLDKLGNNICLFRKNNKLSQEDLASLTGLDHTCICAVGRGRRNISVLNLIKISIKDLIEGL